MGSASPSEALLRGSLSRAISLPEQPVVNPSQPLPYCVYVLCSLKDHQPYIGYTTDLPRRLGEHNQGKSKATAPRRPLRLIFCEFYAAEEDAKRRENYFKTSQGKRTLKLMLSETLSSLRP